MTTWAVIPAKSFARAKSRLTHLSLHSREKLARELFDHVVARVRSVPDIAGLLVLTNGADVAERARAHGARVFRDRENGVSSAQIGHLGRVVDAGLAHLDERQLDSAVVLMADLPELSRADVCELVALAREHSMVVAPDRREQGTNALAVSPPGRFSTCFGHPDSLARHLALGARHGVEVFVHRSPTLARDLDVPDDLTALAGVRSLR